MIYIEKKRIRSDIEKHVIEIQAMEDWKNLEDGNAEKNRYYFDLLDKTALRESLVEEQHGLCAYCMRRIRPDKTMKIEHCIPIKNKNESLRYSNLLGVCDGGESLHAGEKELCCDASKRSEQIKINVHSRSDIADVFYTKDGFIKSRSHKYDHDINSVLHLNGVIDNSGAFVRDTATQLVANRKKTYEACSRFLENKKKKYKNEEQFLNFIEKTIDKYENRAEYEEYLGVTLYFLKRRLRGRA